MRLASKWTLAIAALFGLSAGAANAQLTGDIKIDGSSTVYLISEAMATHFKKLNPEVNITVGISGTGGGFKKFANGETDIQDASRAIKPAEIEDCKKKGVEYVELQVAWDGLAILIHPDNTWAKQITIEQLKKIWHPDTAAKKWSDVDSSWPDAKIQLFGPGPDSGTFDFFTDVVNGKEKVSRTDYNASEDDNTIIQGISGDKNALGYLGLAYAEANKDKVAVAAVMNPKSKEFVTPSAEAVLTKKYAPLSRPLFIYVKLPSLKRPEVREFTQFYLRRTDVVAEVRYVPQNAPQQLGVRKTLTGALKAID